MRDVETESHSAPETKQRLVLAHLPLKARYCYVALIEPDFKDQGQVPNLTDMQRGEVLNPDLLQPGWIEPREVRVWPLIVHDAFVVQRIEKVRNGSLPKDQEHTANAAHVVVAVQEAPVTHSCC